MQYVSVILPLKLGWEPCYSTNADLHSGDRVGVSFAGRAYVGVVHRVGIVPDCELSAIRGIKNPDTGLASISAEEILLWEFMADYYLCTIGEVYKLASPMLKLSSEIKAVDIRRRAELRAEKTSQRMSGTIQTRIARLQLRLENKRSELVARIALEEKGGFRVKRGVADAIREELTVIAGELGAARAALAALEEKAKEPETGTPVRMVTKGKAGAPELYVGTDRLGLYKERIREALEAGTDALVLVPEVAAGEMLEKQLSEIFTGDVLLFTSGTSPAKRRKTAEALRASERSYIIVGTRASLFLPFRNLGLVIIDNEQDVSYKQTDHAPRFNARDVAVVLARIHGAGVLLGSACPSLESLYNCMRGKYEMVRSGSITPFNWEIIDIPAEKRKNGMVGLFSRKLIEVIGNSKGPVALVCGWEKKEELQKETEDLFGDIDISLLSYYEAVRNDLSGFAVTALVQADFLTRSDDFRCDERAYQTLSLISEMSGGTVVVQTSKPGHQVFNMTGAESLLPERKMFGLPPFGRIVDVHIQDANGPRCSLMASRLKQKIPPRMEMPTSDGVVLRYLFASGNALAGEKSVLRDAVLLLEKESGYTGHVFIDVDPLF